MSESKRARQANMRYARAFSNKEQKCPSQSEYRCVQRGDMRHGGMACRLSCPARGTTELVGSPPCPSATTTTVPVTPCFVVPVCHVLSSFVFSHCLSRERETGSQASVVCRERGNAWDRQRQREAGFGRGEWTGMWHVVEGSGRGRVGRRAVEWAGENSLFSWDLEVCLPRTR